MVIGITQAISERRALYDQVRELNDALFDAGNDPDRIPNGDLRSAAIERGLLQQEDGVVALTEMGKFFSNALGGAREYGTLPVGFGTGSELFLYCGGVVAGVKGFSPRDGSMTIEIKDPGVSEIGVGTELCFDREDPEGSLWTRVATGERFLLEPGPMKAWTMNAL